MTNKKDNSTLKDWFEQISPDITIDIGAGSGERSKLINSEYRHGKWTAIEIWASYLHEFNLDEYYNRVIIGPAQSIDYKELFSRNSPCKTTLVIIGGALEHIKRSEAIELLDEIRKYADNIIIATRIIPETNKYDISDKSYWGFEDMSNLLQEGLVGSVQHGDTNYFLWQKTAQSQGAQDV